LLGFKLKKWLSWLGVDAPVIAAVNLWCLDQRNDAVIQEELTRRSVDIKRYPLPASAELIGSNTKPQVLAYLAERKIDTERYQFYWASERTADLSNRVIVPFYYQHQLVGYTARSVVPAQRVKYYMQADAGNLVFNLDRQNYERRVVIVCEGPFDAMSIDGVAVMHNEISSTQAQLIHDLHKQTVVVPDGDAAGYKLIESALNYEFAVSFPDYLAHCKDVNEATVRYGPVYVLKDILANTETNPMRIRLRAKKFQSQFK
jgi:DNA primase